MKREAMAKNKQQPDPIPSHFGSIAEAAEFWDSHDLSDYPTKPVDFEVDIEREVFLTALEPELAQRLAEHARKHGVSTETLINVRLTEKVLSST
jgi:hypothetical protein